MAIKVPSRSASSAPKSMGNATRALLLVTLASCGPADLNQGKEDGGMDIGQARACLAMDAPLVPECEEIRCKDGYQDNDGDGLCEPACETDTCGPGTCDDSSGKIACKCNDGAQLIPGKDQCEVLPPPPQISDFKIDCSKTWGFCASGGEIYPITFKAPNAVKCQVAVKVVVGSGTAGLVSLCEIQNDIVSALYTTGSIGGNEIEFTIEAEDKYGQKGTEKYSLILE